MLSRDKAIRELMDYEGYDDIVLYMDDLSCDILDYPGICLACGAYATIEPDVSDGECQECGYKKNYAALDFHHLNPKEKDVNWNTSRHWSWNRLVKELDKCVLVCHNCHAEIHYPDHFE